MGTVNCPDVFLKPWMWIDFFWAADRQRMRREFAAVFPEASRDGLPTVGKASRLTPRQCPRAGKTLA
jgi:hypothetical protein